MGDNLPPGVSVSDLPGCGEPREPERVECAVCHAPVFTQRPLDTPHFCEDCTHEDLLAKREAEHERRLDERRERYFDRHGHF